MEFINIIIIIIIIIRLL